MDPNPIYGTDTLKSWIAELFTFGRATPYKLAISWTECSSYSGTPTGDTVPDGAGTGYPFENNPPPLPSKSFWENYGGPGFLESLS
jgi:hypothetical protein